MDEHNNQEPIYLQLEPTFQNNFDANQYRERNNASWDRNRIENASSVRSEPTNFIIYDFDIEPVHNSHSQIPNQKECRSSDIDTVIEEDESEIGSFRLEGDPGVRLEPDDTNRTNIGDGAVVNEPPKVISSQIEELPDIYCMICDHKIDSESTEIHTSKNCEENKPKKSFTCSECDMSFNYEKNLNVHKVTVHMKPSDFHNQKECELCPLAEKKSFFRLSAYKGHVKQHFQIDNFMCKVCSVEFEYQADLKKHVRHEHELPSELVYCPHCQDVLVMEEKISHILLHVSHDQIEESNKKKTKPKPHKRAPRSRNYKCKTCDKTFERPIDLRRHEVVHNTDDMATPKWKCAICNKEYKHQTGLYEHKRTAHGDAKRNTCKLCGFSFTKKSNLDRHITKVHPLNIDEKNKERYECEDCPSVFTSQAMMTTHKKRVHNFDETIKKPMMAYNKISCDICKREFKELKMLEKHKQMHLMVDKQVRSIMSEKKCEHCNKRFIFPASLVWHRQTHFEEEKVNDEGMHVCAACKISFTTQEKYVEHVQQNHSIKCNGCQQNFVSKTLLENHICNANFGRPQLANSSSANNLYQPIDRVAICRLCKPPQRLVTLRQINEHRAKHQPRKVHLCWTCHKSFRTAQLLSLHRMVHSSQPSTCPICKLVFRHRVILKQHIRSVHSHENNYQCVVHTDRNAAMSVQSFGEYGIENEGMEEAARAQSVVNWMEPPQCNLPAPQNRNYQFQDGPLRCQICKHSYENLERLCDHWQENEAERDHSFNVISCPVCHLQINGTLVASHIRFHHLVARPRDLSFDRTVEPYRGNRVEDTAPAISLPKKVHECTECHRIFKKKFDLTRHLRTHTGERPFSCPRCQLTFSVKSTMKAHMNVHTNNPATHECGVCRKRFFTQKALVVHMRLHTGDTPFKCKYCDECFRTSARVNNHQKFCSVKNDKYYDPNLPSTSRIDANSYPRDIEISETMRQISAMPEKRLQLSSSTAFQPVQHASSNLLGSTYIITKPIDGIDFVVVVQPKAPPKTDIRETVDTVSCVNFDQTVGSEISIVLHNNMRLMANISKLIELVRENRGVVKMKIRTGQGLGQNDLFKIIGYEETYIKRCDICEVDFNSKIQSDQHFYSADHETAQLMYPSTQIHTNQIVVATPSVTPNNYPAQIHDDMFNCKRCGKRFLDLEPLLAHITKEHDPEADTVPPPRPAAHTAPIH